MSTKPRLKVYVAGSSKELDRVADAMAALRESGVEVTHDWVEVIKARGSANPLGASAADCAQWAWEDLLGVRAADVVWLMVPAQGGLGCYVEYGYALALNIPVVISGEYGRTIFTALTDECHEYDSDALEALLEMSRGY